MRSSIKALNTSLQSCILASAAFGRLSHCVFYNHNLTISTKFLFFFLAAKLGHYIDVTSELWKTTTSSLCKKFLVHCMEHLIMQHQLRWVGHVIWM